MITCISDEEWNADQTDTSVYLMNGTSHVTLPRPSRHHQELSKSPDSSPRYSKYHQEPSKYKPVKPEDAKPNGFSRRVVEKQVRDESTGKRATNTNFCI